MIEPDLSGKRWKVILHIRNEFGAHAIEMGINSFAEIDEAIQGGSSHVVSVHAVPVSASRTVGIEDHRRQMN